MQDRTKGPWLQWWMWLLLPLLILFSELQAQDPKEKRICLEEGKNLTVYCIYTIGPYASSLKAWQRVGSQGSPETLVRTNTRDSVQNLAQAGRYVLQDQPLDGVFLVTIIEQQRQDLGLYQCVIDLSPRMPKVLPPQIRLLQCTETPGNTSNSRPDTPDTDSEEPSSPLALDLADLPVLATVLTLGFILNKILVLSVLFVLIRRTLVSDKTAS